MKLINRIFSNPKKNLSSSLFLVGILIIPFGGLAIITSHLGVALKLLTIAFWVFLVGLIVYLWQLLKNEK